MKWKAWYGRPLTAINDAVSTRLRTSTSLTRLLFGVKIGKETGTNQWDYTTLVLKKALEASIAPGQRVLEIGVGDHAVLSVFIAKKWQVELTAVDIDPEIVANAKLNAACNGVSLTVKKSDVFSQCTEKYHIVFWNCPYVPRQAQHDRRVRHFAESNWDGGTDGTDLVRRFLSESPPYLESCGKLLLGVNTFYVPKSTVIDIVNQSHLKLVTTLSSWTNPSEVFVLEHRFESSDLTQQQTEQPTE